MNTPSSELRLLEQTSSLMGGPKTMGRRIHSRMDAHDVLGQGIKAASLRHLVESFVVLHFDASVEKAIGLSYRTYLRGKETPDRPLSVEQSGRAWKFAEILTRTTAMLGSQRDAEIWLERPALGLDSRRPIDLMSTPAGLELVETYLGRLEYGVYT